LAPSESDVDDEDASLDISMQENKEMFNRGESLMVGDGIKGAGKKKNKDD